MKPMFCCSGRRFACRCVAALLLGLALGSAAGAEPLEGGLTLGEAVDRALARNPELRAGEFLRQAASARVAGKPGAAPGPRRRAGERGRNRRT